MCEKIITKGSAIEIDSCIVEELEEIKNTFPNFKEKFQDIMSCCGHSKYTKTFVVQNNFSQHYFEWFSGTSLSGNKRSDSRAPFYTRDDEGHYYIPEVVNHKKYQMVRVLFSLDTYEEHWLQCSKCKYTLFRKGREKKFLETYFDYWLSIKWICVYCEERTETTVYHNKFPPLNNGLHGVF